MKSSFLVLIGLFYLFAAGVAVKAHLGGAVMDTLIRAIELRSIKPAELWRLVYLLLGAYWVGLAGLFALFGFKEVAALFVFSLLWQALYLLFFAPQYFDAIDEPDASGRAQTWRAFITYGVVTACILWMTQHDGGLESFTEAEPWKGALTLLASAGGLAYLGVKGWQATHWPQRHGSDDAQSAADSDQEDSDQEDLPQESEGEPDSTFIEQDDSIPVTIRPSWNEGGLFNTDNGQPIDHPEQRLGIPESLHDLVSDWLCLWRDHADPADPRRQALLNQSSLPLIDTAGQVLLQTFKAQLGAERVHFSPYAEPRPPQWQVSGLRLMADYQCNALWFDAADEGVGDIPTEKLGLSWSLSRDLDAWALSYDESFDKVDPGGTRLWSREQDEAHGQEAQALLERLRRELDATGRAGVRLRM